jgi:hypothetical protein
MIENVINFLLSPAYVTGPGGFHMTGPFILVEPTLVAIIVLSIGSLVWVWKDATKRNKSGFIALLFILLTGWPASFIWWFWLRPPSTLKL